MSHIKNDENYVNQVKNGWVAQLISNLKIQKDKKK